MTNTKAIGIDEALSAALPPDNDQAILYGTTNGSTQGRALHSPSCVVLQQRDDFGAKVLETCGGRLHRALADAQVNAVCFRCLDSIHEFVLKIARDKHAKRIGAQEDCSLLLYCEAWKPGNVNEWVNWLYGQTPEQIQEQARKLVRWDEREADSAGNQTVYFQAYGFDETSWVMVAGNHVSVRRAGKTASIATHGALPRSLWQEKGNKLSVVGVPVGPEFTRTHLQLAVALFEENVKDAGLLGHVTLQKVAKEAVETAQLCAA